MALLLVPPTLHRVTCPKSLRLASINLNFHSRTKAPPFAYPSLLKHSKAKTPIAYKNCTFSIKTQCFNIPLDRDPKTNANLRSFKEGSVFLSSTVIGGPALVHDLLASKRSGESSSSDSNKFETLEDRNLLKALIDPDNLRMAVLAFYRLNSEFLIKSFPKDVPLVVLKGKPLKPTEDENLLNLGRSRLRITYAPGKGTMHMKSMLLYFPDFLRVVIGSGDLVESDWDQTASICYVQDFPLKQHEHDESNGIHFRSILQDMMNKLEAGHNIPESLNGYNFNAARGWLVSSVPGVHVSEHIENYGHPALAQVIRKQKLANFQRANWFDNNIHYMCTALGRLTYSWLAEFRSSALGFRPRVIPESFYGLFQLKMYFPTVSAVKELKLNSPFRSFYNPTLRSLKKILHQMPPSRIKILASLPKADLPASNSTVPVGWVYCGSHNCSASAWGTLVRADKDDGQQKRLSLHLG
ncbi:hypothetical protein DSO57_1000793 [Entomophthora muscae]|uniref:Uncharacterized protein n=1 Tax=Entomophthora muscae TaxID=34485 RepID=A0ACC2T9J9_9FUNG|nr:hypothetical protein DSO57_1000793 [Entomophthora muscae]